MITRPALLVSLALALTAAPTLRAQVPQAHEPRDSAGSKAAKAPKTPKTPVPPTRVFDDAAPLTVTFSANLARLKKDRGETPPWRAATLSYTNDSGRVVMLPVRARTRGIWRRNHCKFPPLRLDFAKGAVKETAFAGLDKPKLVNFCDDSERGDRWIVQEAQLYRALHLLTPLSHRARLLRIAYADSATGIVQSTRYALLVEEADALAARVGGKIVPEPGMGSQDLDGYSNAVVGLFQYLAGNTDWSVGALHNIELVRVDSVLHSVAYDFDFSGVVDASYATPAPSLKLRTVRQRKFRGYCFSEPELQRALSLFQEKKDAIYGLYRDEVGRLLDEKTVRQTLEYFDEFYETIGDPRTVKRDIIGGCLKLG